MIEYSNTRILEYSNTRILVCVCVGRLRRSSSSVSCASVCLASVVLSRVGRLISRLLVGNWLILCVGRHSKSFKGGGNWLRFFFAICLASYYPLAVFYNAPMLKYPSHHLIYIFYHPMPIMPLY